jgi:hypothetical protein
MLIDLLSAIADATSYFFFFTAAFFVGATVFVTFLVSVFIVNSPIEFAISKHRSVIHI